MREDSAHARNHDLSAAEEIFEMVLTFRIRFIYRTLTDKLNSLRLSRNFLLVKTRKRRAANDCRVPKYLCARFHILLLFLSILILSQTGVYLLSNL